MEYLYAMMLMLDDRSLIEYYIKCIPDSRFNKAILYQSKTITGLKENIGIYENVGSALGRHTRDMSLSLLALSSI